MAQTQTTMESNSSKLIQPSWVTNEGLIVPSKEVRENFETLWNNGELLSSQADLDKLKIEILKLSRNDSLFFKAWLTREINYDLKDKFSLMNTFIQSTGKSKRGISLLITTGVDQMIGLKNNTPTELSKANKYKEIQSALIEQSAKALQ